MKEASGPQSNLFEARTLRVPVLKKQPVKPLRAHGTGSPRDNLRAISQARRQVQAAANGTDRSRPPGRNLLKDIALFAASVTVGYVLVDGVARQNGASVAEFIAGIGNQGVVFKLDEAQAAEVGYQHLAVQPECADAGALLPDVRQWCDLIVKYSQQNRLDPLLVAALIDVESDGDPWAVSVAGASGLMQGMPSDDPRSMTYVCLNGPCFADRPTQAEFFDPEFNIAWGTQHLAMLLELEKGDMRKALKRYGPKDVEFQYADKVLALYYQAIDSAVE